MQLPVRVKICGITSVEAARHATAVGADALGLVFYRKSQRCLEDLALARDIALAAGPFVTVVGLFVDAETAYIEDVLAHVPLGMLQFHGNESNEECVKFQRPYLKAMRMKPGLSVREAILNYPDATGILLDAYHAGTPGGTGETFDWSLIPPDSGKPIVLAGGLNTNNVATAVAGVAPWAVDVSSGVEQSPGVKCPDLVRQFVQAAKAIHRVNVSENCE